MTPMDPPEPPPKPAFWRRWLVNPVVRQLTQGVSPRKIALTLAVGSTFALFPILGTTTTLCVIAGVALGLNQPIIQGVNALCTLIYFPFLYAFVWLGDKVAGSSGAVLDIPLMISLLTYHPREFFSRFGVTAVHAVLGWVLTAPAWAALVYFGSQPALRSAAARLGARRRPA
ncbi:MAG TPA: DUF2062 domain-containing protein [Opitutaceae bacterium]